MDGSDDNDKVARSRPRRNGSKALERRMHSPADRSFLVVNADRQHRILRGLASPVRLRILRLLLRQGPLNVNQIAEALDLPQSTIATNVQVLEEAELIAVTISKAAK